jgi:transposase-like protein
MLTERPATASFTEFHTTAHVNRPQDAMSHNSREMPDIEVTHAFHTTEALTAVEKTLLTPCLRCQIRALALERGTTVRYDSRPRCSRCKVGATARMRSTARLSPLTRREANTPCSE